MEICKIHGIPHVNSVKSYCPACEGIFSAHSLINFSECEMRFVLSRISHKSNFGLLHGSIVHLILEKMLLICMKNKNVMKSLKIFKRTTKYMLRELYYYVENDIQVIYAFFEWIFNLNPTRILLEEWIYNDKAHAIVDLGIEVDDTIYLLDYKSYDYASMKVSAKNAKQLRIESGILKNKYKNFKLGIIYTAKEYTIAYVDAKPEDSALFIDKQFEHYKICVDVGFSKNLKKCFYCPYKEICKKVYDTVMIQDFKEINESYWRIK